MNTIDIIILGGTAVGFLVGLYKGLLREVASLAGIVAAIVCARIYAIRVGAWLLTVLPMGERWSYGAGWVVCFLGVAIAATALGHLLTRAAEAASLGCVNKLLGGIFGGIKYILLFSILFNLLALVPQQIRFPGRDMLEQATLYAPVKTAAGWSWKQLDRLLQPERTPTGIEMPRSTEV